MDYRKKLREQMRISLIYIIIGVILCIAGYFGMVKNGVVLSFGSACIICGIVKAAQYFIITNNDERVEKQEISEKDERNRMLRTRAQQMAFNIYVLLAAAAIITLYVADLHSTAHIVAYTICAIVLIYWVCYWILSRKY